ncbi:Sec-independent protein translocase TatB [Sanguibacter antarcticus]|uniref:Sec-independent protein translocase protein TatB n=1 Tax=Sanguibacter antarcticus TaxID=372484 RepID=A0A2A9E520_9MICO|nr:Sec-independent protein translocase TatB [Sanguibacter antarcticus]PFG33736.1 sec-independent protein translocase protein TatB [Sanguibacter antarcticus]
MFGINGGELIIILVLAVLVIGPERLPGYAEQLATLVRRGKGFLAEAKVKVTEELGPEIGDVDWAQLDPRRYDPRRIVRDALLEDTVLDPRTKKTKTGAGPAGGAAAAATGVGLTKAAARPAPEQRLEAGAPAPFDAEAT